MPFNHKLTFLKFTIFSCFILLVNLLSACETSQVPETVIIPDTPPPNPHLDQFITEYEHFVDSAFAASRTPGAALAIVRDTSTLYLKGLGVRKVNKKKPVDAHTVFRLASVSKGFASVMTGVLVDDQILRWDDKVTKYLPDFALNSSEQTQRINLKHVLSHTTGLPYHTYTNLVEDGLDILTIANQMPTVNLIGPEGTIYSYQNAAYSLIEEVMRSATQQSYRDLLAIRLLKPLNMQDASTSYEAIEEHNNTARPHVGSRQRWLPTRIEDKYYNTVAAGGVNASISDMAQWLKLLLGHRNDIISDAALDTVFTPVVKTKNEHRYFRHWNNLEEAYYALGWRVLNCEADTLMYHGGYVNGYRSEIAVNRKENVAICILANAPSGFTNVCIPAFFRIYQRYAEDIRAWEDELYKPVLREQRVP